LHGMIRMLVGELLGIKKTAPAHGLILEHVEY